MATAATVLERFVTAVDAGRLGVYGVSVLIGDDEASHRWRSHDRESIYSASKGVCARDRYRDRRRTPDAGDTGGRPSPVDEVRKRRGHRDHPSSSDDVKRNRLCLVCRAARRRFRTWPRRSCVDPHCDRLSPQHRIVSRTTDSGVQGTNSRVYSVMGGPPRGCGMGSPRGRKPADAYNASAFRFPSRTRNSMAEKPCSVAARMASARSARPSPRPARLGATASSSSNAIRCSERPASTVRANAMGGSSTTAKRTSGLSNFARTRAATSEP